MSTRSQVFELLSPRLFKAFLAAAETENFTAAAARANMTQPGVSQHVRELEDELGMALFKRLGKTVKLTPTGHRLVAYVRAYQHVVDDFLDSVQDEEEQLKGPVSYAMPPSFLLSPYFPMLLKRRKGYPGIELSVSLVPTDEVVQKILRGEIDFGFITRKVDHPLLILEEFCQEEYILVGADRAAVAAFAPRKIADLRFVHYPGSDVYYDLWLRHYLGKIGRNMTSLALPCAGRIESIIGAVKMVEGGVGFGVFPRHCVAEGLQSGRLFEFRNPKPPLFNDIAIVRLRDHRYPKRVEQVIDWFLAMHGRSLQDKPADTGRHRDGPSN